MYCSKKAKDGARAAGGLDRSDAGRRYRKELDFIHAWY